MVDRLAAGLRASGLADKVIWKISCRAEYVEPELFARCAMWAFHGLHGNRVRGGGRPGCFA